jgi:hypothetical protein
MRLTVELPDELASQLEAKQEPLADVIRRGLGLPVAGLPSAVEEVSEFLARRPRPEEIVAFRPSENSVARLRELLEVSREGSITPGQEAELDTLESLNDLFALVKLQARRQLGAAV